VLALAMVAAPGGASSADEPSTRVIRLENDLLTVRLREVPITDVLQDLATQSGAQVRGQVREAREVTATFDDVPLSDGLARLLGDQAFALVYGSGGRLKAVRLLGEDGVAVKASPKPVPGERPPFPGRLPGLLDRHAAVQVSGAVSEALHSNFARLPQLLDLSLHHADPTVRAEALSTGLAAVAADRELYLAVVDELDHTDSSVVAPMLSAAAGEHAEEVALAVSQGQYVAKFRLMASSVLQRLRRPD
jgi:hypothetical protein